MITFIDRRLNQITMYRLALYYLIFLLSAAMLLAFTGALPYDLYALLFTIGVEVAVCAITNAIFAKAFGVPANTESVYISVCYRTENMSYSRMPVFATVQKI